MRVRRCGMVVFVLVAGVVAPGSAVAATAGSGSEVVAAEPAGFSDVGAGSVHAPAVEALAAEGVLDGTGCGDGLFCPEEPLKRSVMAVWLVRILDSADPAPAASGVFTDVDYTQTYGAFAERLAELAVTRGCATGPLRYCPDRNVTRGQMAAFLVRAFALETGSGAGFTDVGEAHTFAADIDALAASRVTAGCSATPLRFCPDRNVTRAQMATFLARAAGLVDLPDSLGQPTPDLEVGSGDTFTSEPLPEDWLARLNAYRAASGLPPVVENREWVRGIELHLEYLEIEGPYGNPEYASSHHRQNPDSPHYTVEGHTAGQSSNLSRGDRTDWEAIDGWMRAPFHARHMLHPHLERAALGSFGSEDGGWRRGLDVSRGRVRHQHGETIVFPGAGSSVPLRSFTGELPNPLDGCPGYTVPAGLPLIIIFPTLAFIDDSATAELHGPGGRRFGTDDNSLCLLDKHGWFTSLESTVVLIAKEPLDPGQWKAEYRLPVARQSITWCFGVYDPADSGPTLPSLPGCEEHTDRPSLQPPTMYAAVAADHYSACALRSVGLVECWTPPGRIGGQALNIPKDRFVAVDTGGVEACGLRDDGTIACWGDLHSGLTYGGTPEVPEGRYTSFDVGRRHSCAVRDDGVIKCWADRFGNEHGQADPPDGRFTNVAVGHWHTCGIRVGGEVTCWGADEYGYGTLDAPSGRFTSLTAGERHTCGLRSDATVDCWGSYTEQVSPPPGTFTMINAGRRHTCGVRTNGSMDCWGSHIYGEMDAPDGPFIAVAAGEEFSCGVRLTGNIVCWGGEQYRRNS